MADNGLFVNKCDGQQGLFKARIDRNEVVAVAKPLTPRVRRGEENKDRGVGCPRIFSNSPPLKPNHAESSSIIERITATADGKSLANREETYAKSGP